MVTDEDRRWQAGCVDWRSKAYLRRADAEAEARRLNENERCPYQHVVYELVWDGPRQWRTVATHPVEGSG